MSNPVEELLPPLPPNNQPRDEQIIVWVENQGKPFVLGKAWRA